MHIDFYEIGDFYCDPDFVQVEIEQDKARFLCEGVWDLHGIQFPAEIGGITEPLPEEEIERLQEDPSQVFHLPWDDWWVEPVSPTPEEVEIDNVRSELRDLEEGEELEEDLLVAKFLREVKSTTFEEVVPAFLRKVEEEHPSAADILRKYWEKINSR